MKIKDVFCKLVTVIDKSCSGSKIQLLKEQRGRSSYSCLGQQGKEKWILSVVCGSRGLQGEVSGCLLGHWVAEGQGSRAKLLCQLKSVSFHLFYW